MNHFAIKKKKGKKERTKQKKERKEKTRQERKIDQGKRGCR